MQAAAAHLQTGERHGLQELQPWLSLWESRLHGLPGKTAFSLWLAFSYRKLDLQSAAPVSLLISFSSLWLRGC